MSPKPNFPVSLYSAKNDLAILPSFVWMYEVTLPEDPPRRIRLISSSSQLQYRGNTYYPFPITHRGMEENLEGDTRGLSVTASNVSREVSTYLEQYDGLIGQPARVICTTREAAESGDDRAAIQQDFRVTQCSATADTITWKLDDLNLYNDSFPAQRCHRTFCRWQYRSAQCGYSVPESSGQYLASCDKTLDGPNGCKAHGVSEAAANLEEIHPGRFGGFPGIPVDLSRGLI